MRRQEAGRLARHGVARSYLASPRAVDDLHLLRERGDSGSVAWSGTMASHARVEVQRDVVMEASRWRGTIVLDAPLLASFLRLWVPLFAGRGRHVTLRTSLHVADEAPPHEARLGGRLPTSIHTTPHTSIPHTAL